jgi:phosphoglycolate phosphatase-like HAD superfamily hydrolase
MASDLGSGAPADRSSLVRYPENWRWRVGPVVPGPAVVFDMDGVLSDASGRQHFLEGPRMQWDAFFEACGEDALITSAATLGHLLDPRLTVILLTARPHRVRPQTLAWLGRQPVRWDLLVMRDTDDWMSSHVFKRTCVLALRQLGFDLRLAIDDDPANVAMFEKADVPAIYWHSGYYD